MRGNRPFGLWLALGLATLAGGALVSAGCRGRSTTFDAGAVISPVAPVTLAPPPPHPIGLASPAAFGYARGPGAAAYAKGAAAYARKDWPAVETACEAAIAADPGHLEAHRVLASALSRQGKYAAALDELAIALAGDFVRWGDAAESDADLAPLCAAGGDAVKTLVARERDEYTTRARRGLWLVVTRRPASWPLLGATAAQVSRVGGELFALDGDRWLRLSRSSGRLVGWLAAPAGDRVAWFSVESVAGGALTGISIGNLDLSRGATGKPFKLEGDSPDGISWGADGGLRVHTASGRVLAIDPASGKGTLIDPAPTAPPALTVNLAVITFDPGPPDGVDADWSPGAGSFRLGRTQRTVTLPPGEEADRTTFAWSPTGARVAFATTESACAADPSARGASIYVVEGATGKLRVVAHSTGPTAVRWTGDDTLAYEASPGEVRVLDVRTGAELTRIAPEGGAALVHLFVPAPCAPGERAPEGDAPGEPIPPALTPE